MDIDRDPTITIEWKEGSFPQIELTEKTTGLVLTSIEYFGAVADDARPLRDHVQIQWRADSKAFSVTVNDRFYSTSKIFAMNERSKFVEVDLPDYETMTGFPSPKADDLQPRGRAKVRGWNSDGHLIYYILMTPIPSYTGEDPLEHTVLLNVTVEGMTPAKKMKKQNRVGGGF